jgi:hypothetical protein
MDQRTTRYALAHGGSCGQAKTRSTKLLTTTVYPRTTYPNPTPSDEARTIQGLTVSYFRLSPTPGTLMLMGAAVASETATRSSFDDYSLPEARWLVQMLMTYTRREAICGDEPAFGDGLRRHAMPEDDTEPLTPRDVPPLVASHLDWARPTSKNKMYDARIEFRNFGGRVIEHRLAPTSRWHLAAS